MATDLKTVYDHPANLIVRQIHHLGDYGDLTKAMEPTRVALTYSAKHLRDYEDEQGVTFAALDNHALEGVREAYEAGRENPLKSERERLIDLLDAVNALLGLGDE